VRQDDDAVCHVHGLVDVVRDEEDRDAVLLLHPQDEILEVSARLRVDGGERLVHQQDRRLVGERAGDRDTLLHAPGELPRIVVDEARQPDRLERLLDERGALALLSGLCRSGRRTLLRTDDQGINDRLYSWKTSAISSAVT
jgi:hypothetical protein